MLRVAIFLALLFIAGCSSTPHIPPKTEQFCDLKTETVVVKGTNGEILSEESKEVMVCNDNKIDRLFYSQSGMASNCGEFNYWTKRGNYDVQRKGVSCQKPDGSWEIVNTTQW